MTKIQFRLLDFHVSNEEQQEEEESSEEESVWDENQGEFVGGNKERKDNKIFTSSNCQTSLNVVDVIANIEGVKEKIRAAIRIFFELNCNIFMVLYKKIKEVNQAIIEMVEAQI